MVVVVEVVADETCPGPEPERRAVVVVVVVAPGPHDEVVPGAEAPVVVCQERGGLLLGPTLPGPASLVCEKVVEDRLALLAPVTPTRQHGVKVSGLHKTRAPPLPSWTPEPQTVVGGLVATPHVSLRVPVGAVERVGQTLPSTEKVVSSGVVSDVL